jgi:hypothetical protein
MKFYEQMTGLASSVKGLHVDSLNVVATETIAFFTECILLPNYKLFLTLVPSNATL